MKSLNPIKIAGKEYLPLVEGGKGISVTNGVSAGAWAAKGGVGTFSGVNADSYDENGQPIPQLYQGKTRLDRHRELIQYAIDGTVTQVRIARERSNGVGRLNMNILWEMGGARQILEETLRLCPGLIDGVTCGAGMPYQLAEICARHGTYYFPIVSSARTFRALWKRSYHRHGDWLGGVVYEDPWRAGGHNGLSNSEDPEKPEPPLPRVIQLRQVMREFGLPDTPIIMAGSVWFLREWEDWLDNPEVGPIAFQFGTRPLLTQESPISDDWKRKLLTLEEDQVFLNRFSPTGFYSSAVRNDFLEELAARSERQIVFSTEPIGAQDQVLSVFASNRRQYYITEQDRQRALAWMEAGYTDTVKTPESTLIFVTPQKAREIKTDQAECMGCLSACRFSSWAERAPYHTDRKADPRSFCIQKTLQRISHEGGHVDNELMFAGHNAYRFVDDPFYRNGFIPTVGQLVDRISIGD